MSRSNVWTLATIRSRCVEEGDCHLWDQAVNSDGYPQASINGKCTRVQRYLFINLLGNDLLAKRVVSQHCGNRLCCAPNCQHAITYSARLKQAYRVGDRSLDAEVASRRARVIRLGWATKLDMGKAREIRARTGETLAALGREFNVDPQTIADIRAGKRWREVSSNASVFSWAG